MIVVHFLSPSLLSECNTSSGGGKSLQWTIVIDGQANKEPITSYGPPTLSSVVVASSGLVPVGVNAIRTDGNITFQLLGQNFGPSTTPLVQYVRATSSVAEYATTSFTIVSDSEIDVMVGPGVGKNLSFSVRVAEQDSLPTSHVSFDYKSPAILAIHPSSGPTFAASGFAVQVTGTNFGLSAGATVAIQFGNVEDNTMSGWLSAQPVFPAGDDGLPKQRPNETVQFQLPAGVGLNRAVRVIVYPSVYTELAVSSDPTADGAAALFNYTDPVITTILSAILDNSTTEANIARSLLGPVRYLLACNMFLTVV